MVPAGQEHRVREKHWSQTRASDQGKPRTRSRRDGRRLGRTLPQAKDSLMSKPTVILVHGAFGDASSWRSVFEQLDSDEYNLLAAAIPLRGLANDVSYLGAVIDQLEGPVVLVGHSYSGCVV